MCQKLYRRSSSLGDLPTFAGLASEVAGLADELGRSLEELSHAEDEHVNADACAKASAHTPSTNCMLPCQVKQLARKHELDVADIEWVLQCLRASETNMSDGRMALADFEQFVLRAFEVPTVNHKIISDAYISLDLGTEAFNIDDFFAWYKQNAFAIAGAAAECMRTESENCVDALATKLGVSNMELRRIRRQYKGYDADHSGGISLESFTP